METKINFIVTKEERKALVKAIGEFVGCVPVYKGAPSFSFAVINYIIDRHGSLIYDERTDEQEAQRLLEHLSARGFICEAGDESPHTAAHEQSVDLPEDSIPAVTTDSDAPEKKTIIIDMPFFNETALDNLRKLISGKAALIKKAIGIDDLAVAVIGESVHFNWFSPDSIESELDSISARLV